MANVNKYADPDSRRRYQIILCQKCFNTDGTMVRNAMGFWEHKDCKRAVNLQNMSASVDIRDQKRLPPVPVEEVIINASTSENVESQDADTGASTASPEQQ